MRFGVNYVPTKKWFHAWIDFDKNDIKKDLETIKGLGMDHIRVFLVWPYFQVNPTMFNDTAFKNLKTFSEICEEVGLDFMPSVLSGWMSGFFFFPSWMYSHAKFEMFTSKQQLEYQKLFFKKSAETIGNSPAFLGFDLGNELSCVTPLDKDFNIKIGDEWQNEMLKLCEELAPGKLNNNGVDHLPWLVDHSFTRDALANTGGITALHCWSGFTGANERSGLYGTHSIHLGEYMCELAKAYANDINRKVWIQEFGCTKQWVNPDYESVEEFTDKIFDVYSDIDNLWGLTWWCSHDLSPNLTGYLPHELDFGLIDNNNNPKPVGLLVADRIKSYKKHPKAVVPRTTALVFDESHSNEQWYNVDRFMQLVDKKIRPTVILPRNVNNAEYLKQRGITEIIK